MKQIISIFILWLMFLFSTSIATAQDAVRLLNADGTVVDSSNPLPVDGSGVTQPVTATAGVLDSNSPTTEATIVKVFNAGDITATNMGASTAITITGSGTLTEICVFLTTGTITTAENIDIIFFKTDPTISENTADLTVTKAKQISNIVSLRGSDFTTNFATAQVNCQAIIEPFAAITHLLVHVKGATSYTDEVMDVSVSYRRTS